METIHKIKQYVLCFIAGLVIGFIARGFNLNEGYKPLPPVIVDPNPNKPPFEGSHPDGKPTLPPDYGTDKVSKKPTSTIKKETTVGVPAFTIEKDDSNRQLPVSVKQISSDSVMISKDSLHIYRKVLWDFTEKRTYKNWVMYNEPKIGKFTTTIDLQYNEIEGFRNSVLEPVQKVVKERFQPFGSASYSTLNYVGAGGGFFYNNIGVEYQYLKDLKGSDNAHLISGKIKF